jgi:UDP-glucose 4-epimerase
MNILVTGGLGFIGSFLVERLVSLGHKVDVVDNLSTGSTEWEIDGAEYHIMDVVDFCAINTKKFDVIYHLANNARISMSFEYPKETLLNNYQSTIAILEYMRSYSPDAKLYYASSSTTEFTDKFNNPYTFSKFTCDDILELYKIHYGIDYTIVKFYNVYGSMREADLGEYTTIIRKFKQKVEENEPLPVYGPDRRRDFTHIDDTVDALEKILSFNQQMDVYHIGTGTNFSIKEIAEAFDHPIDYQLDKRKYELHTTLSKPNIPGWITRKNVIEHIKQWKKDYAIS